MKPVAVKQILDSVILKVASAPSVYVCNPEKDFSRNRKLPFQTVIKMLIGMGGGSLGKELMDWFGYTSATSTYYTKAIGY